MEYEPMLDLNFRLVYETELRILNARSDMPDGMLIGGTSR